MKRLVRSAVSRRCTGLTPQRAFLCESGLWPPKDVNFQARTPTPGLKGPGSLRKDCRGIGGFFEEMPVLIIVLISLTLFLSSFVHAYGTYVDNLNTVKTHELARQITDDLRTWDGVLDEGENADGMLSYAKLTDPNFNSRVLEDFNASTLRFEYSITITDISGYDEKVHASVSSSQLPQERVSIISITSPVIIVVSDTEHHAAWLTVRIWGWY